MLLSTSPERTSNFDKSQLMVEMETGTKYVKPSEDSKKISNEILGDICYRMQVQLISDQ